MRKTLLLILLNTIFFNGFAQTVDTNSPLLFEKYTAKCYHPVFVVDEKPVDDNVAKATLDDIDPWAVIKVLIAHGNHAQPRDVVYITTGRAKINAYQQKFGKFSAKYAAWLKSHKNWDGRFMYMLDGKGVSGSTKDIIDILYNLPAGQKSNIYFSEEDSSTGWNTATVRITTS